MVDANTEYITGYNGQIFKTTDGGTIWSLISTVTLYNMYGIYFIDSNIGYSVGENGTIIKTEDGGNHWVNQNSGTSNNLVDVKFLDANMGIAAGWSGTILKTTNGGSTWVDRSISLYPDTYHSICLINSTTGYILGVYGTVLNI